jgi:hypothetical protein
VYKCMGLNWFSVESVFCATDAESSGSGFLCWLVGLL